MSGKLLTEQHLDILRLQGGCTGLSESIHVKIPNCWESHVAAQIYKPWVLLMNSGGAVIYTLVLPSQSTVIPFDSSAFINNDETM